MRVPLSWLRDYVDLDESPQQIADRLTFAGIEVEGIETIGTTYAGLVVGEVRAVEKHPNADRLTVCRVGHGQAEVQVVCGAPNVQAGGKYPFAPVGATIPKGGLVIKQAKIRGVESFGMLCAADELNLSADHAGLFVLDARWAAGTPLAEVLGPPETVFELEITPNRPDCLSMLGVARELAAMYRRRLKRPEITLRERGRPVGEWTRVEVEDSEGCPRYTARLIDGVQIAPSPLWMQRRLEHAGIRAINNVVDITNYVMLETGQPLHAFDQALLSEGRILVRRARAGEKMATLDNVARAITPAMLVIADAERPVAVAGVMGGAGSEIRQETRTVLLESAWFKASDIRATSRTLALSTDSSYRFERGVDPSGVEWASRRAAGLLAELAGGICAPGVLDIYPQPVAGRTVICRLDRVRRLTGIAASDDTISDTFEALELGVERSAPGICAVRVPVFRADLEGEVDLAEEFARLHGLDNVPTPVPHARIDPHCDDQPTRALRALRDRLAGLGLQEICNYSLVSEAMLNLFDATHAGARLVLPNPISADQSVLRTSLVPQMVETLGRNRARQIESAALFEVGRVFQRDARGQRIEATHAAIGLMGAVGAVGLRARAAVHEEEVFLWIKGVWEALAEAARLAGWTLAESREPWFEPGYASTIILGGQTLGGLGIVKASIRREWRLNDPVAVLEVDTAALADGLFRIAPCRPIPVYPSVARDVAMVASESVKHEVVERVMRAAAPKELESIRLFDIFRGPALGEGRKSLAYSLTYRAADRTLTDAEANGYHDAVKAALRKELLVEIRES